MKHPLAILFALRKQLEDDRDKSSKFLRERDQRIKTDAKLEHSRDYLKLVKWLEELSALGEDSAGAKIDLSLRVTNLVLMLFGVAFGASLASVIFSYDGSVPVNLVRVLVVFAFLPFALLFVTLLAMLPAGVRQAIPGTQFILDLFSSFSPGRLIFLIHRLLPFSLKEKLNELKVETKSAQAQYAALYYWISLFAAQLFSIGFVVGALLYAIGVVVLTDLAFVWSTTLNIDTDQFHRFVKTIALPWASIFPDAVPSLELVEQTKFYRLRNGIEQSSALSAKQLTGWWSFLLLAIVSYGLLPRLILGGVISAKLKSVGKKSILHAHGAREVLSRLSNATVSTQSATEELIEQSADRDKHVNELPEFAPGNARVLLIDWAGTDSDGKIFSKLAEQLSAEQLERISAGGKLKIDDDLTAIAKASDFGADDAIVVLVKLWEPPMEEFFEFLTSLRGSIDNTVAINVVPISLTSDLYASRESILVWQEKIDSVDDAYLSLKTLK